MPPRSKVAALPPEVKEWLDKALVENNFGGYELLAAELKGKGYEISKTGLHRYGQQFEDRLNALKIATEQARAVVHRGQRKVRHQGEYASPAHSR